MNRVLIVDDDPASRRLLEVRLRPLECDVATAGNGELALSAIRKDQPDLVLLDLQMPRMGGMTQEIETRIGGRILGTMAVNSKMRRNGALVRIVIQASVNANTSDKPEAPSPKIKEFNSNGYASGSL